MAAESEAIKADIHADARPQAGSEADRRRPSAEVRAFGRDEFDRDVWSIMGTPVDMASVPEAVQAIELAIRDRQRLRFVTPNLNYFVRAVRDPVARDELIDSDLSFADGAPLVRMARLLGAPLGARCAGSDIFEILRRRPGYAGRRVRVFFFGGRDGSAAQAAAAVNREKRGVEAAGFLNPGFGDIDEMSSDDVIASINASDADFVLVALGAAKGERWIARNRSRLDAPVIAHLGAVVDFAAGAVARAPKWVQKSGMEWVWRIKEEPALWRRYWADGTALLGLVATRLAPLLVFSGAGARGAAGDARVERDESGIRIVLDGDFAAGGLDPVRRAFREATRLPADVTIDFSRAGRLDPAFFGQLLVLEKVQRRSSSKIQVCGLSRVHRRLFFAHMINYPTVAASQPAAAPAFAAAS